MNLRNIKIILTGLILQVLLASSAQALETITLSGDQESYELGASLWYLEDYAGRLTFAQISAGRFVQQWQVSRTRIPAFGYTDSAYWFAIALENADSVVREQILELAYPVLDDVDVYVQRADGSATRFHTGDRELFSERPIEHYNFLFPIRLAEYETVQVYLRIQSSSSLQVPLWLWQEDAFWSANQGELILQWLYCGIMLAMVLFNLFIFFTLRDESYLFYVLFVAFFATFQFTIHGLSFQYLWPQSISLNENILMLTVSAAITFGAFFVTELLRLRTSRPFLYKICYIGGVIAGLNTLATPWLTYKVSVIGSITVALFACLAGLVAGIVRWADGYTPARYFTIAWVGFLVGTALFALNKFGFVPRNFITENAIQIGSALEVMLLSFALADRINTIRKENDYAQRRALAFLQQYRTLYENAIEGIFQLSLTFKFASANRSLAKLLGFTDSAALLAPRNARLADHFADPDDAEDFIGALRQRREIIGYECQSRRCDGNLIWTTWSARSVCDQNGNVLYYEGSLVDITARKEKERAEHECKQAASLAHAKSEFLANMSHEIRTPINAVLGMAELLLGTTLDARQKRYIETIGHSSEILLGVINDVLDLSKIEAGKMILHNISFDLAKMIDGVVDMFADQVRRKGLALTSVLMPESTHLLYGDLDRLRQILVNLISNAIKFTEQGSIRVTARVTYESGQRATLRVEVKDSGVGIPSQEQAKIFEVFAQVENSKMSNFGGTGLGLAICRKLVDLMEGSLGVRSQPGQGSTFWFEVPLRQTSEPVQSLPILKRDSVQAFPYQSANEPPSAMHTQSVPQRAHDDRILLVDDNPINQEMVCDMLHICGYRADVADNGDSALLRLDDARYALVLMDCQMPLMDGYQATREIRRREKARGNGHLPVVALTANALTGDRERCLAAGMDDYLAKPFKQQDLRDLLKRWLEEEKSDEKSLILQ